MSAVFGGMEAPGPQPLFPGPPRFPPPLLPRFHLGPGPSAPPHPPLPEKEKTPMCRVAELARFNKLTHEYKLLNESGPAHQKTFDVLLRLTDGEEWPGKGPSIKKAQQDAAANALKETKLRRPDDRRRRLNQQPPPLTGTPTVLLNAVAHQLGTVPVYKSLDEPIPYHMHQAHFMPGPSSFSASYPPPLMYGALPPPGNVVCLRVAGYEFVARGPTKQIARHHAAAQALSVLHPGPLEPMSLASSSAPCGSSSAAEGESLEALLAAKSPISLVHEVALQKRMDVSFEVLSEEGPAHDRKYHVRCKLTDPHNVITAEGRGASKKAGKQAASAAMASTLRAAGPLPLPGSNGVPRRPRQPKELKRKTILKDAKMNPDYGVAVNPVSRLIQIQQVKGAEEPRFDFISESGHARSKEFTMQVRVETTVCEGRGQNKKLAKRAAAEAMLAQLGYAKEMAKPGRSVLKKQSSELDDDADLDDPSQSQSPAEECNGNVEEASAGDLAEESPSPPETETPAEAVLSNGNGNGNGVKEEEEEESTPSPVSSPVKELLPSLINNGPCSNAARRKVRFQLEANRRTEFMVEQAGIWPPPPGAACMGGLAALKRVPRRGAVGQTPEMSRMAREMLAVLDSQARIPRHSSTPSTAAIQQLNYLASILSFHIHFTDFPRTVTEGGRAEHLSLVSLGVAPPRVCHGSGASLEEARNEAAVGALRALADAATPPSSPPADAPPPVHSLSRRSAKIAAANSQLKAQPKAPCPCEDEPPPNEALNGPTNNGPPVKEETAAL